MCQNYSNIIKHSHPQQQWHQHKQQQQQQLLAKPFTKTAMTTTCHVTHDATEDHIWFHHTTLHSFVGIVADDVYSILGNHGQCRVLVKHYLFVHQTCLDLVRLASCHPKSKVCQVFFIREFVIA